MGGSFCSFLVAGVERAVDAEAAPALAVPVGVGPAGGLLFGQVNNLAFLAADPAILATRVCKAPLHQLEVLGGGCGPLLLGLLVELFALLSLHFSRDGNGCQPNPFQALFLAPFLFLAHDAQSRPGVIRVHGQGKRPNTAFGVPFATECLDRLLRIKGLAAHNQLSLFAYEVHGCVGG